ncbi:alpha/beta hydrolase [Sphingosinicella rhizophila]|uniref:Alpha/beta hydrolase-fold protein n=1 Tax=Sphingosinicella rhizophila TaxID=3050082 RepID=A0ABU3QB75_9SPHN|nr:alpha/beta hydrolase-fold protein [Sphingosinicella sp. GR2756]MDT9600205.1 alpha/beta hydrolase-fold protein [Sphingosinicella sp. GR2756]
MISIPPKPYVDPLVEMIELRSEINGRSYEVRIGLPLSYHKGEGSYPLLVVLDADMIFGMSHEISMAEAMWSMAPKPDQVQVPEMIVVGISLPDRATNPLRRNHEYMPKMDPAELSAETRDYLANVTRMLGVELETGGAPDFLEILRTEIIPLMEAHYRVDTQRRILTGVSASGTFCCYTLFTRPDSFTDYIIVSPGLMGGEINRLESAWARQNDDLRAGVLLTAGGAEIADPFLIYSATARMAEQLGARHFPGLRLHSWFIPGATHVQTAAPSISRGLVTLLGTKS